MPLFCNLHVRRWGNAPWEQGLGAREASSARPRPRTISHDACIAHERVCGPDTPALARTIPGRGGEDAHLQRDDGDLLEAAVGGAQVLHLDERPRGPAGRLAIGLLAPQTTTLGRHVLTIVRQFAVRWANEGEALGAPQDQSLCGLGGLYVARSRTWGHRSSPERELQRVVYGDRKVHTLVHSLLYRMALVCYIAWLSYRHRES